MFLNVKGAPFSIKSIFRLLSGMPFLSELGIQQCEQTFIFIIYFFCFILYLFASHCTDVLIYANSSPEVNWVNWLVNCSSDGACGYLRSFFGAMHYLQTTFRNNEKTVLVDRHMV